MSKMLEISFSFSLNVILSMSKIDEIHLRAVMVCIYVEDVEDGKRTYTLILAHNFLNIQPIFNPQKVLES